MQQAPSSFCCASERNEREKETKRTTSLWSPQANLLFHSRVFASFVYRSLCNFPSEWFLKNSSKTFAQKKQNENQHSADHEKLMMSWGLLREQTILILFLSLCLLHFNWRWRKHLSRQAPLSFNFYDSCDSLDAHTSSARLRWSKTIIHSPEINQRNKRRLHESLRQFKCFFSFLYFMSFIFIIKPQTTKRKHF